MHEHVSQMMYFMLGIVILVFVTSVGILLTRTGRDMGNDASAIMGEQPHAVQAQSLEQFEYDATLVDMPVAVIKSLYFESGDVIINIYDLTHVDDDTVVSNIDPNDINYDQLEERSLELINALDTRNKVKLGVAKNTEHTGLYDLYIHDIRCKAEVDHTGTCKTQSVNNGAAW